MRKHIPSALSLSIKYIFGFGIWQTNHSSGAYLHENQHVLSLFINMTSSPPKGVTFIGTVTVIIIERHELSTLDPQDFHL